jgi:tetratricopeptide (TPR) repeat protein
MRIFLSFNSKDAALAEAIRAGLSKLEPDADIFFSPVSLGSGLWLPKLGSEIAEANAFLLLVGPKGIGPWQEVEYYTAFDRHVSEKSFTLVPVIAAGAQAPGLSFLRSLNWVEATDVTEDAAMHRVVAALKGDVPTGTTPLWKLVNPYCGLEAMTEANADYFYGRTAETSGVLNALASRPDRLPILIGASGVGKSSVALAGVLSALKAMRWPSTERAEADRWPSGLQNSRGWVSLTMRPGAAPLEALASAFIGLWGLDTRDPDQAALPRKWAKGLFAGDNKLADLIGTTQEELKKRQGDAPERVLLYLDQGEELYTHAAPNADDGAMKNEARRFSEVLAEGLSDSRVLAFASLRADYFDRLQADEPLFKHHEHVNVPPLDRDQLQTVVSVPARALGVTFEDDKIADRITDAAAAEPGALPLLSYLLTDMWADMVRRGNPTLGLPAHAIDIGGVLASRAEAFLKGNPHEEKALRRLLTLKLAIVPAEGEPVRRQTRREECTEAEWSLASRLADNPYRLVVMSERETDGNIIAEVAHEAFLRAWPRLAQWLRDERDFLVFKGEAERAQRRWRDMGQADKALLTGLDLTRAEEWLPKRLEDLSAEVIAYVQRSIAFDRAIKERLVRFQRRVATGAIVAALLTTVMGAFAWIEWGKADRAQQEAEDTLTTATQFARLMGNVDTLLTNGDMKGALAAAARARYIMLNLSARNPDRIDYLLLLSVSSERVGDVQVALGALPQALISYQDSLTIIERLVQSDPRKADWRRDLSLSYNKVGSAQMALGDLTGAFTSYQNSLAITAGLAQSDPDDAGLQRDLSVSYERVGNVQVAQGKMSEALASYKASLAIADRLAKTDPENAGWQRDRWMSFQDIGNVQAAQGDLPGALMSYQNCLAIIERLVQSNPDNAEWQRDLALSYRNLADVYRQSNDVAQALTALQQGQSIMQRLVKLSDNADWKNDLALFNAQITALTK